MARSAAWSCAARDEVTGAPTYNPLLPEVRADPYPTYHALRSADPVHYSSFMDMWILTRYRDVELVLRDPLRDPLRDHRMSADRTRWNRAEPLEAGEGTRSMLTLDPPDHTRLRSLVSKAFTPRMVERLRPRVEAVVDEVLDRASRRGSLELIDELAYPLPVTVIAEMLGVPPEDWPRFRAWSSALVASLDPLPADDQRLAAMVAARDALASYVSGVVAERRAEPGEDLISALLAVEEAGEGLSSRELVVMVNLLLVAGHETTVNLIGNAVWALLRNPDQASILRARPRLIRTALEELLRWDSPVQLTVRVATEDLELGGRQIRSGEMLMALLGAANRDPEQFPEPDRLDVTREPNPHLAFGRGIHFCLGAPLARLEAEVALSALIGRFDRLRLAGDPQRAETVTLRGLRRLPLFLR